MLSFVLVAEAHTGLTTIALRAKIPVVSSHRLLIMSICGKRIFHNSPSKQREPQLLTLKIRQVLSFVKVSEVMDELYYATIIPEVFMLGQEMVPCCQFSSLTLITDFFRRINKKYTHFLIGNFNTLGLRVG